MRAARDRDADCSDAWIMRNGSLSVGSACVDPFELTGFAPAPENRGVGRRRDRVMLYRYARRRPERKSNRSRPAGGAQALPLPEVMHAALDFDHFAPAAVTGGSLMPRLYASNAHTSAVCAVSLSVGMWMWLVLPVVCSRIGLSQPCACWILAANLNS